MKGQHKTADAVRRRERAGKILAEVAIRLGTEVGLLRRSDRGADAVQSRQQAIYLCHVHGSVDISALSHVIKRDRATIHYALRTLKVTKELKHLGRGLHELGR